MEGRRVDELGSVASWTFEAISTTLDVISNKISNRTNSQIDSKISDHMIISLRDENTSNLDKLKINITNKEEDNIRHQQLHQLKVDWSLLQKGKGDQMGRDARKWYTTTTYYV